MSIIREMRVLSQYVGGDWGVVPGDQFVWLDSQPMLSTVVVKYVYGNTTRNKSMNATIHEEIATLSDIEKRFDDEWVLVEDPEFDANDILVRGKVLWHSKDRDEVYRKDLELRPNSAAYLYTGPIPENILVNF